MQKKPEIGCQQVQLAFLASVIYVCVTSHVQRGS